MKEQIKAIVEKDGKITLEVQGARGYRCLSVTESLEKELGEVLEREKTGEFYKSDRIHVKNNIRVEDRSA